VHRRRHGHCDVRGEVIKEVFDPNLICPLCGVESAQHNGKRYVEREHIPPKSVLISQTGTDNLITVPSCENCNRGTSNWDEEFKICLGFRLGGHLSVSHPMMASAFRSLRKNKRLREKYYEAISPILVRSPVGYVHPAVLDEAPLNNGIRKIARGLHWHVTGEVIPPHVDPEITAVEQGRSLDAKSTQIFVEFGTVIEKCGNMFEAVWAVPNDAPNSSIWLLRFCNQDCFIIAFRPWANTASRTSDQFHA
jgi:hypothetical protein